MAAEHHAKRLAHHKAQLEEARRTAAFRTLARTRGVCQTVRS